MDFSIAMALMTAVGVLLGVAVPARQRIQLAAVFLSLPAGVLVLSLAYFVPYALHPAQMAGIYSGWFCVGWLFSLPAALACACTQGLLLWSRSGNMKITTAAGIILGSTAICSGGGCLLGYLLGTYQPAYYRSVFSNGNSPTFDPVAVGIGLGLTQGLTVGLIIGCVVVLAIALRTSPRFSGPKLNLDAGGHFATLETRNSNPTEPVSPHVQPDISGLQSPDRGI